VKHGRARTKALSLRKKIVTHQGSPRQPPAVAGVELSGATGKAPRGAALRRNRWRCHCCGLRCAQFVRRFLTRRRAPRTVVAPERGEPSLPSLLSAKLRSFVTSCREMACRQIAAARRTSWRRHRVLARPAGRNDVAAPLEGGYLPALILATLDKFPDADRRPPLYRWCRSGGIAAAQPFPPDYLLPNDAPRRKLSAPSDPARRAGPGRLGHLAISTLAGRGAP